MAVKVAAGEMLLDTLLENPDIKAAVLVDVRGHIVDKRGSAACLKLGPDEDTLVTQAVGEKSESSPTENLYLVRAGTDFLVLVFDSKKSFEALKEAADSILGEFDMAPDDEEDEPQPQ